MPYPQQPKDFLASDKDKTSEAIQSPRTISKDEWMDDLRFNVLFKVFPSYQDDGQVQRNTVCNGTRLRLKRHPPQSGSNPRPLDQKASGWSTELPRLLFN